MNNLMKHVLGRSVLALALVAAPWVHASTFWTGPSTNFTQFSPDPSDEIIPTVVLTRGSRDVLYNTAAGETGAGGSSPLDTEWAFGTIDNATNLSYQSLESMRNSNLAGLILNQNMVMHIVTEDIYVSVMFTAWGQHGAGGWSYTRSTAPAAVAPTVTITNPVSGAVFSAPANVHISANAQDSGGTVTNVSFFRGNTLVGSATSPPFTVTASGLAAGSYSLTAVATAAGLSTTSTPPVSITVVTPVAVTLASPRAVSNRFFIFTYTANPGLSYVVLNSSNLTAWTPLVTNVPASSPVSVTNPIVRGARYFRVGRMPNP